jgi:hypothetical protein
MAIHVEVCFVGLALGFEQRGRFFEERYADNVRSGFDDGAQLKCGIDIVVADLIRSGFAGAAGTSDARRRWTFI